MYMSVLPAFFYLLLCFHTTTDFQIRAAAFFSAIYAIIMMAVIVGTTIQIAEDSWTSPNAVFLMLLFFKITLHFPKLQSQPVEFLQNTFLDHLNKIYKSTCVGLRYGTLI